ncbi:unnamed protein product [Allacma fusca]|uniref:Uncharacterized protein n=1 Tax=Allacma fusca TaxID=39272 RepID=A0A8J2J985_9HEXA|nr:unnamed protein product [Allacma fusca]
MRWRLSVLLPKVQHTSTTFEFVYNLFRKKVYPLSRSLLHEIKHRTKRTLWMSHDRKFILPKGTILDIAPKLQIPFIRQPPEGLNSDIQLTWHFYMYFDKLGMTSDNHPWPLPFLYPFSGFFPYGRLPGPRPHGGIAGGPSFQKKEDTEVEGKKEKSDIKRVVVKPTQPKRKPRSILSLPPPEKLQGGERAILIPQLEKMLGSMGYDGRSCLLRAVCEIHEFPLHKTGYGLFGEILTLVFSVSLSDYADSHLPEYAKAEEAGKAGECSSYFKNCTKSMFVWEEKNKYSKEMQNVSHQEGLGSNTL